MIRPAISSGVPRRPSGICGRIFESSTSLAMAVTFGADVAGRDRVNGHALARDFQGQGLGETVHAGFGCRIVGLPERTFRTVDRRDVDDAPPAAIGHAVHDVLGHVEDGVEVGADDRIPVRLGHLLERRVLGDPRIVDQDVDGPDILGHAGDAVLAGVEIRNVDPVGAELAPGRVVLAEPVFHSRVAWRMSYHHAIACRMHLGADRFAQAAHSACDDCYAHLLSSQLLAQ